jgi:hypothetical protein
VASLDNMSYLESCSELSAPSKTCIWLRNLPALSQQLTLKPYLPPNYIIRDPAYSNAALFANRTGCTYPAVSDVQIRTAQTGDDMGSIAERSFLQGPCGIFINSRDRISSDMVGMSPRYQLDSATPSPGGLDKRLFPWKYSFEREVVISFSLGVTTLNFQYGQAQLYGLPVLTFLDQSSGKRILVAIETYGTSAPQDLVARDTTSEDLFVATVFRGNPAFGKRLSGDYIQLCATLAECGGGGGNFRFAIGQADFRTVLQAARGADSRLSANPADYLIASFEFRNEVFGDGELGLKLTNYKLEVLSPGVASR